MEIRPLLWKHVKYKNGSAGYEGVVIIIGGLWWFHIKINVPRGYTGVESNKYDTTLEAALYDCNIVLIC